HQDADIRLKALQIVSTRPEDLAEKVAPLLSDGDRRIRMLAIHYLHSRNSAAAIEAMKGMQEDSDPGIQAAIVASDLNDPDESQHEAATRTLQRMISQYPKDERAEIADILGYIRVSKSSEELLRKLLSDPELDVQRAALRSIARVTPPGLTGDLMDALDTSPLATEIRAALSSYGESLIPQLQKLLDEERGSRDKKKLIIRIARSIGGNQALQLFLRTAKGPDLSLRFAALKGMNQLKRSSVFVPKADAESLLTLEVESLEVEWQREQFVNPEPDGLMAKVLKQRKEWAQERIFRVLGLIYDSAAVQNAFLAWRSGDPRRADKAAEWLDATLRPEHRKNVLHFVDRNPRARMPTRPRARQSILVGYIGAGDQLPAAALIDELTEDELSQQSKDIKQSLKFFKGLTLVEETLNWRFSAMKGLQSSQSLTTIQKLEYLSRLDIFAGLGPQELLLIAYQCTEAVFEPGQMIIQEGDKADEIYLLIEGELERLRSDRSLEPMMPGESFGVLAGLSGTVHFYSVRAVTKSLCLQIRPDGFQEILEDYPVMALGIFRVMRQKMQTMLSRIEDLEGQLQQKST
ncbi:MAG TPA: cyclic nucleotide-binding domain-containing protein, partial [Acidobacteriota bacterium]|nr:cyclic nucleotide-binding domain-containing protein [Acidobacteriota bacterium]